MKECVILINMARGPIVDDEALADALDSNRLFAAQVDVFEVEPPIEKNHRLLDCPRVLVTPHIAFVSE